MSAGQIKSELVTRWSGDPILQLCLRIVEFVERLPESQRRMLTFRSLLAAADKKSVDDDFMRALTILVSSRIAALDAHALLVDEDETEHEIAPEELARARETGELLHPEKGFLISDFEAHLVPFFVASARFSEAD